MTPDEYAARPNCRHCGRSAHGFTWACAVMAALLNGGFAGLTVVLRAPGSRADESRTET